MGCWNTGLGSLQKWDIGNVLRTLLLADEEVSKQVGNDIYPIVAPENTDNDFIIYRRIQYSKNSVKVGVYQDECEIAVLGISDNYDDSISLASKIDNVLTGKHTLSNGYSIEVMLNDSTEMFEDNKFVQTLIFKIR